MTGFQDATINALGSALALGIMLVLAQSGQMAYAKVPFATSIVLVLSAADTHYAQPRNILGGHLVSTLCGLLTVSLFGQGPMVAAAAMFLSVLMMQLTRTMHPPAGIDPVIVATEQVGWSFLLLPVGAGAVMLIGFALVWRRLVARQHWPLRWR